MDSAAEHTALKQLVLEASTLLGMDVAVNSPAFQLLSVVIISIAAVVVFSLARLLNRVRLVSTPTSSPLSWISIALEKGLIRNLLRFLPGIVIYLGLENLTDTTSPIFTVALMLTGIYLLVVGLGVIYVVLDSSEAVYNRVTRSSRAPITGFIQVSKLILTLVVMVLSISLVMGENPLYLLSGLTAIAAVLILVFRDIILGFVAGIQIAANRMFNLNDWIEMPKYRVNGEIREIGLTVVKVQNWDNSISTIPTYNLTADVVTNWRGMVQSGGRRIMRSMYIDLHSISSVTEQQVESFRRNPVTEKIMNDLINEINDRPDMTRPSTNLGWFRIYLEEHIRRHPKINVNLLNMIRALAPNEYGLPLEVYCFTYYKEWSQYEKAQAELFEDIFALVGLFNLKLFQRDSHIGYYTPPS